MEVQIRISAQFFFQMQSFFTGFFRSAGFSPNLGRVVLSDATMPDGWATPLGTSTVTGVSISLAWPGTGSAPHGTHAISLTARNACGPSDLSVSIVVPKVAEG